MANGEKSVADNLDEQLGCVVIAVFGLVGTGLISYTGFFVILSIL